MHIIIAALYGVILWLAAVAYAAITGLHWRWVLMLGPFVVSGGLLFIIGVDFLLCRALTLYRKYRPYEPHPESARVDPPGNPDR